MSKIRIEFQDQSSTEFKVDASGLTYRQLLVAAQELSRCDVGRIQSKDNPVIEIEFRDTGAFVHATGGIMDWRLLLVADEFHLAAQHIFFTQQNQAMLQSAQNQQAIAALQHGGRGNSGLVFPRGAG